MSDADEDQRNELEALAAIFDADFHLTRDEAPRAFELVVVPNSDGQNNHIAARLVVELPPTYPQEGEARIRVRSEKGLQPSALEELSAMVAERVTAAAANAEVAVYTVAEAVREWLAEPTRNVPALSMHAQMAARMEARDTEADEALARRRALEARIEAKKKEPSPLGIEPGTLLTPESFAHWRGLFDAEQRTIREAKEAARPRMDRLTGKQLFQQNLARELGEEEADSMAEEPAAAVPSIGAGKEVFCFNEDLFAEDVDDEDDEDEDGEDESDDDEDVEGLFDTETEAQKAVKGSSASAAAASSSSSSSSSAAAAPAAAKKQQPSSSSASSSSSSAAASGSAASAARPSAASSSAAAPARPAGGGSGPPGFSGAASSSSSSSSSAAPPAYAKDGPREIPKGEHAKQAKEKPPMSQSERDKAAAGKAKEKAKAQAAAAAKAGAAGKKKK